MPEIQFLVSSGPPQSDAAALRRIRSHAMRVYRRKKRNVAADDLSEPRGG
jgi:hypothetical protein